MTAECSREDGVAGEGLRSSPDPNAALATFEVGEDSSSPTPPHLRLVVHAFLAALGALSIAAPAPAGTPVELELVLAVDASSSVDDGEFALQMRGIAAAFRDADVQAAIAVAGGRGIAVALIQWSEFVSQRKTVDWTLLRDAAGAAALADDIAAAGRAIPGGGTAIYGVINFALHEFDVNGYDGRRQVIDVSGDGRSDLLVPTTAARDRAVGRGVAINGLAILDDEPMLDEYYRRYVIGGAGAFVMTAADYDAFAEAIAAKLIREIGGPRVANRPPDDPHMEGVSGEGPSPSPDPNAAPAAFAAGEDSSSLTPPPVSSLGTNPYRGS